MPAIPYPEFSMRVDRLYAPPESAQKTYLQVRQILREFGELPCVRTTSDLDELAIVDWKRAHSDRGDWRTRSLLISWRAVCNYACKKGYLDISPFAIKPLKAWIDPDEPECVSHHALSSIDRVLRHLERESKKGWSEHRLFALAATVAFTGVRAGEAHHAWVEDFHVEEGIFDISPRRKRKTKKSAAPVPIPPGLRPILERWLPLAECKWAFPGLLRKGPWVGGPKRYRPVDRLKAAGEACGVKGFTFQSLRHSWATHAESAWSLSDPQIQRNLRHTTIRTSKQSYRHPDLPNLRAIGEKVVFGSEVPPLSVAAG